MPEKLLVLNVFRAGPDCEAGFWCSMSEGKFLINGQVYERFHAHEYGEGKSVAVLDMNGQDHFIGETTPITPVRVESAQTTQEITQ